VSRRWPAEWEPHRATWLAWPHNETTWPGIWETIPAAYATFVSAVRQFEPVELLVPDAATADRVSARDDLGIGHPLRIRVSPTNDSWVRDFGPLVVEADGRAVSVDWRFDAWGGKYPGLADDVSGRSIAEWIGAPIEEVDHVLEGGSIDGNGAGVILTTESCLLETSRRRGLDRRDIEALLARHLGVLKVLWLGRGVAGDDTDGHVDDLSRFVGPGTIVTAVEEDPRDANHEPLDENERRLQSMRDLDGRRFEIVRLPMPDPVVIEEQRLPASYANFYIVNGGVLVPTFACRQDESALATLARVFPGRRVVGIDCRGLVLGLGTLHCLSLQEPLVRR
jgi:agmatine deiminase